MEATGTFAVRDSCTGSGGKTSLACLPPRARSCPAGPRDAPQVEYSGPYRPSTGNLSGLRFISLAGLDGEKERGLQGMLTLGCSLLPAERAA